jgi:hypothetical protein
LKKIAIFTEGQTEQIFTRECLLRIFDPSTISFECLELLNHNLQSVPYKYPQNPNPQVTIYFLLINCHGDEGVLSSIRERERDMIEKGFKTIFGLRDLYCAKYNELAKGKIDENITLTMKKAHAQTIANMINHDKIGLYYAIMEVESWFLGMYNLFEKIDNSLTIEYIHQQTNFDLRIIDPQSSFYHPTEFLCSVLGLCGMQYSKKRSEVENLCKYIDLDDLDDIVRENRCVSFKEFRGALEEIS